MSVAILEGEAILQVSIDLCDAPPLMIAEHTLRFVEGTSDEIGGVGGRHATAHFRLQSSPYSLVTSKR